MKKSVVVLIHLIFWILVYWSILTIISQFDRILGGGDGVGIHALILTISCVPLVYTGYFAYPYLLDKRYTKMTILIVVLLILCFSTIAVILDDGFIGLTLNNITSNITYSVIVVCIGGGLKSLIHYAGQKKKQENLEKQNMKSELAFLRTQLNPHFLFNTLNNIDTLIFESQEKASSSLLKLSEIMRYMLFDSKEDFVELDKELENLNNYIELEKLRLKNQNFLKFSFTGNTAGLNIAPMILMPFVENAFKHSVDSDSESGIVISIKTEGRSVCFLCENKFENNFTDKDSVHGIGLDTIRKRLELIYQDKYRLNITSAACTYTVNLELQLDEN